MRGTKVLVIVAFVFLIVLVIVLSIVTRIVKQNSQNLKITPTPIQTKKYQSQGKVVLSRVERLKEASKITKNANLLTKEQKANLEKLETKVNTQKNKIIETEDFKLGFSEVTNQFYVQKKTAQAEEKLREYLKENNVLEVYEDDPAIFILTDEDLKTYIPKQQNYILEVFDEESIEPPKIEQKNYDEVRKENREKNLNTIANLTKELFSPSTAGTSQLADLFTGGDEEAENESSNIQTTTQQTNQTQQTQTPIISNEPSVQGILYPPNLGSPNSLGYYMLPNALNGEYVFGGWNTCTNRRWGSKTLIGVIYTVAKRWHAKYPNSNFTIGDLNATDHASHGNGVDFDLMVYGNPSATQITASADANIELGKMLIDTGVVKLIIFGTSETDQRGVAVRSAWKAYANSKGLSFTTYPYRGHDDHFHIRINDEFRGPDSRPGC